MWTTLYFLFGGGFSSSGPSAPSPAVVTALSNQFLPSPQTIAIDASGHSEIRPIFFDFRKDALILEGDSLVASQTLVFSQKDEGGEPALTLYGWTQVGNVAAITCSATGAEVNAVYELICRADTVQGNILEKTVPVLIVGDT